MPAMEVKALLKRAEKAETKRQHFARLMQDIYAYSMPERDSWTAYGYGQERSVQVYDSAAVVSTARFANRLQQALFPPGQRWCRLSLPPEQADADGAQTIQRDLEAATNLLFRHIHASNFDMAQNEACQELAAGVSCLLIENGRLGTRRPRAPLLRFQAIPSGLVGYDEGPFGVVEGIFFRQNLQARLVRRTYPDAKDVPDEVARLEREDPEQPVPLLQATTYDAEDDVFRFEVVHIASEARFVERSYRTNPWVITRWTRAPGETHGRGPLTQALPDIRTVNKLMELMLKAGSLAIGGAWTVRDDGVVNPANVRIVPGAMIPVASNGSQGLGRTLAPLEFPGNFQLSEVLQDRLTTRIRTTLFDDPLPPEIQRGVTATEIIERVRRFQADTGAFGRLMHDGVVPIVMRCLDIMDQAGEFSGPRFEGLMKAVRDDLIRIRPTSPLSGAQDQADVQAVMSFANGAAQLGEFGLALLRSGIDVKRAGPWIAERTGVPQALIPTQGELAQRDAQEREAATEAQALQSPVVAQAVGALAGAAARAPEGPPA